MNEISPTDLILALLAPLLGANLASPIAPHMTVVACGIIGAYMGRDRLAQTTRLSVVLYIIGMTFIAWIFTSAVLNAIHAWLPEANLDDRLWIGPVSWFIAYVGLRWRSMLYSVIGAATSKINSFKTPKDSGK